MSGIAVETFHSIHDIDPQLWDALSGHLPFQSYRWYEFGETVMSDCEPVYLLFFDGDQLIARASFWVIRNEPLPKMSQILQRLVEAAMRRWPLFVCRSPLSNSSGLVMQSETVSPEIYARLQTVAIEEARRVHASFVLVDYLIEKDILAWHGDTITLKMPSPGTVLVNQWRSLDEFLADGNKKDRQHYKRSLREADKLGIRLTPHKSVQDINKALELIHIVEERYGSTPNPWTQGMLEHLHMVDGTWLAAQIDDQLVGCGLMLEDQGVQLTTALGLAADIPYVYFRLVYASLETALTRQVRLLRWGTGAYEVKRRLGFEMEKNNYSILMGTNRLTDWLARRVA